ncbi:MAG: ubiquinol-cytochrome c reductase iron-sulfur subunit [Fluviicola sp.]
MNYYANYTRDNTNLVVPKSEFWEFRDEKKVHRKFVLLDGGSEGFPICIQKTNNNSYVATLMKCTHRGCELNVGGGIYTCPCHGSEFSINGEVLEGPADVNLKMYQIKTDDENIYILNA